MVTEDLITPEELAKRLQVNTETVYRKRDELPHYRFGSRILFDWSEVKAAIRVEPPRRTADPRS